VLHGDRIGQGAMRVIRILLSRKLGELRWTQADLSRATGIRPGTINEYYHEFAERVNLEHIDLICEALNCDLSDILERIPNAEPAVHRKIGRREPK
jgi:XRE family transcriptional regulator